MSAKRRNRKIQNKRSTTDVDPYTERYRKASDGAKAARAAAKLRGQSIKHQVVDEVHLGIDISDDNVHLIEKASLSSVSLVPEGQGTGYIIAFRELEEARVGEEAERELLYGSPAPARGVGRAAARRAWSAAEEAFRAEASPDAAALGQRGAPAAEEDADASSQEWHKAFFEAEVNLVPTHIDTQPCDCNIAKDHWVEVGEN